MKTILRTLFSKQSLLNDFKSQKFRTYAIRWQIGNLFGVPMAWLLFKVLNMGSFTGMILFSFIGAFVFYHIDMYTMSKSSRPKWLVKLLSSIEFASHPARNYIDFSIEVFQHHDNLITKIAFFVYKLYYHLERRYSQSFLHEGRYVKKLSLVLIRLEKTNDANLADIVNNYNMGFITACECYNQILWYTNYKQTKLQNV